ncbi:DUF2975 domain-containing protein [Fodinibius halophilus]|uniref:DUF2975 domain-containing protein n=1 Tax=Fodinibius halophilus TaxID=1736908 RepID=A0A6M1T0J0_9BACT|nr:DUF2975 domain-containing protein [Fodinibius halophilus]NGP87497.1 DUF2975 domain-containing protein [Fodinibius halophilus]
MTFNKDWTLAHFLYYISQIGYVLIGGLILIQTFTFFMQSQNNHLSTDLIPVQLEVQEFKEASDIKAGEVTLHINEEMNGRVRLSTSDKSSQWPIIGFFLVGLLKYVILAIVLFLFSKLFKTIIDKEPFSEKNPTYLFTIGWILFLAPFTIPALNFFVHPYFASLDLPENLSIAGLTYMGDGYAYAGIFILVLGYVFKEGNRLYKEQQLTI